MADKKLSDKEIERRKQAALRAVPPKPHENFVQAKGGGKSGPKPLKARMQRHQGR
jgi:hypothetical protein